MDEAVSTFLASYPELEYREERGGIVHCSLSGHDMPCRLDVLQAYVEGKKFVKLKGNADFNYHALEPFIIPSRYKRLFHGKTSTKTSSSVFATFRRHSQLFCALTNRYINKRPEEVKTHLAGKKYTRALDRYKTGSQCLFKERGVPDQRDHPQEEKASGEEGLEGGEGEGEADGEKVILTPPDDSGSERDGMEVDTAETNNSKVEEVDHPRNVSQESGDMPGIGAEAVSDSRKRRKTEKGREIKGRKKLKILKRKGTIKLSIDGKLLKKRRHWKQTMDIS